MIHSKNYFYKKWRKQAVNPRFYTIGNDFFCTCYYFRIQHFIMYL